MAMLKLMFLVSCIYKR